MDDAIHSAIKKERVELHCHTKYSLMDGLTDVGDLIRKAADWGYKAIAITDHACVQAFPDAWHAANSRGIKVIYGTEGYLKEDGERYHITKKRRKASAFRHGDISRVAPSFGCCSLNI